MATHRPEARLEHREIKLLSWLKDAPQVVVHSHYAARAIGSWFPHSEIHVLPHFAYQTQESPEQIARRRVAARKSLAIGDDVFVLSTLGFATANKQYAEILRAIGQFPAQRAADQVYRRGRNPAEDMNSSRPSRKAGSGTRSC